MLLLHTNNQKSGIVIKNKSIQHVSKKQITIYETKYAHRLKFVSAFKVLSLRNLRLSTYYLQDACSFKPQTTAIPHRKSTKPNHSQY